MSVVVNCIVRELTIAQELILVMSCMCAINPVAKPSVNLDKFSHSQSLCSSMKEYCPENLYCFSPNLERKAGK
jgi:hypothetical protein